MPDKKRISLDVVGELLTVLYLRLNGYFTTGFLVHGDKQTGLHGELDAVAIRFPHHIEETTRAEDDVALAPSDEYSDLVVAEVKTTNEPPRFNRSLSNCLTLQRALLWAGVFEEEAAMTIGEQFHAVVKDYECNADGPPCVLWPDTEPTWRIRAILFAPKCNKRSEDEHWYIHGQQMSNFISNRLTGGDFSQDSAMRYSFGQWGLGLRNIVDYYKTDATDKPTFNGLLKYMEDTFRYGV